MRMSLKVEVWRGLRKVRKKMIVVQRAQHGEIADLMLDF